MASGDDDMVVEFKVGMTCEGCSGAVTRILTKLENVSKVDCNIETKQVLVTGKALDAQLMLEKLQKWGTAAEKSVELVTK
ncbi:unnamed protein product [Amoebophrya sp. A120]|nr:unnamed protein product [Amoebophrya sp. A120]|eukprot:GSA120T00017695001.1